MAAAGPGVPNSRSTKLSLAAVNAAPFVPGSNLQEQAPPRSLAAQGFVPTELPQPRPNLFGTSQARAAYMPQQVV